MRHRHAQFSFPTQLPALIKASRQSVDRIPATACPLCHWDATLRDLNKHTPSDETLVVTLEQFRQHLGAHMEQLALFALPRSYKDEEANADSNEAAAMAYSDSSSRHFSTEAISWKTVSSGGATFDKLIPDVSTSIAPSSGVRSRELMPWSQQSLACIVNPFPRYGAAMSQLCSKEGHLYFQGGLVNGVTFKSDIWKIETNETPTCYVIATAFQGPEARVGHAALLVGNAFIIFGGDTKRNTEEDPLDDSLYLLNTSSKNWSRSFAHKRPSGRYGHTLSLLGTSVVVFGGQHEGVFFNDLSAFDLNQIQNPQSEWETLSPNEPHLDRPLARTSHTMVSWDNKLYLFGGTNGELWFNDVWEYSSLNGWTQLDCIGYIPLNREGHAAAVVDGVMYIFGGRSKEGHALGDLARFRFESRRWYTFVDMGPSPSPRSGHQMAVHNKKILVVGGEPQPSNNTKAKELEAREELALIYTLDTSKIWDPRDGDEEIEPPVPSKDWENKPVSLS